MSEMIKNNILCFYTQTLVGDSEMMLWFIHLLLLDMSCDNIKLYSTQLVINFIYLAICLKLVNNNNVFCLSVVLINFSFLFYDIGDSLACDLLTDIRNFLVSHTSSYQLKMGCCESTN
jgi:hypothetical protein